LVARAAVEEAGLERLYFVPAAQSPFKPGQPPSPAAERLRLLRIALAGYPEFAVDDQEIRRGGISYTVDTLRDYAARFPGAELHYLVGADHVATLPQWRDAADLARIARFIVVPRPDAPSAALPSPFRGQWLRGFPLAVSSSEIRRRVREGLPIDLLTGSLVAEAIAKNRLYL
jgi:nicotinate-nucleotide adenylyltransferase